MIVKEVMSSHVEWLSPDTAITEVARMMRDKEIGCTPVGENDRLIGMITDRDITCRPVASGDDLKKVTARDVMSKGMFFCFEDEGIDKAIKLMQQKEVRHLTVLNRQKRMVGLVSLGDLALKADPKTRADIVQIAARDAARHKAA
jgi:predicted transcriptional regulator